MKRVVGPWRALRRLFVACALLVSKAASAALFLFNAALLGTKAALGAAAGALGSSVLTGVLVVGGAYIGYKLLHADDPAKRSVQFLVTSADGGVVQTHVKLGSAGENNPALAPFEGLPVPPSSQPAPGVASTPAAQVSPAQAPAPRASAAAQASCGASCRTPASPYLQALALSTMVHWDDRVNRLEGWPVVNYCRKGVTSLGCSHNDLWLRNDAPVSLQGVRICVPKAQQPDFLIIGAGPGDCLRADIAAGRDLHIDVTQRSSQADYPSYPDLFLDLSLPERNMGARLKRLQLPVVRPLTFFGLNAPTVGDREHDIGVQVRRVNLLAEMIVFTYHGSGDGYLDIISRKLGDPKHAMRIVDAREHPAPYRQFHLPECLPHGGVTVLATSRLAAGESCGVLVHAEDVGKAPYEPNQQRTLDGQLQMKFQEAGTTASSKATVRKLKIQMEHAFLAGGDFHSARSATQAFQQPLPHVAIISGNTLHALPGLILGQQGSVRALGLTPDATRLCIGGRFRHPTGIGHQMVETYMACQSGEDTWSYADNPDGPDAMVRALTPDPANGMLYVGGSFHTAAGLASPGIAALDVPDEDTPVLQPANWRAVGGGVMLEPDFALHGEVHAMLLQPDGRLAVGGLFFHAMPGNEQLPAQPDPLQASMLAWWNPQTLAWEPGGEVSYLGGYHGVPPKVAALAWYHGALMVGGRFNVASYAPAAGVPSQVPVAGWARYDPQQPEHPWTRVAPGERGTVDAFAQVDDELLAGGTFVLDDTSHSPLLSVGDDLASHNLQPLLLQPPQEVPVGALHVMALATIDPVLCMGGHFLYSSGGALGASLACRNLATTEDLLAGKVLTGDVRALLAFWEMQVNAEPVS